MIRLLFIQAFMMLAGTPLCQTAPDVQRQLDDLRGRIRQLEKENQDLMAASRKNDSITYCTIRFDIFEAFAGETRLEFDFKSTSEKISMSGLFTRLMQANNPASDILGFRFTDLIFSSVEKHFNQALEHETDRSRFSQVISKIISNPVVASLASSNPIASVVSTVISCVIGFTTNAVEIDREGGRVKDISVAQQDAFDSGSIAAFRNEMQVYINFYDELIQASQRYLSGLEELNARYAYLMASVRDLRKQLHSYPDLGGNNELIRLTRLLPEPGNPEADFKQLIQDKNILNILAVSRKFPVLQQSVSDFKKEYNLLLFRFLSDYICILHSAEKFPDQIIDKSKTTALISEIESFINSQKSAGNGQPDAFQH